MDNELILFDRIEIIKSTIDKYGEDNFFISFSGGKDSTVLHYLVDMALPANKIPRVYVNTGIEYNDIVKFVEGIAQNDERIEIIQPSVPIKKTLERDGYPFKSKEHAKKVDQYWRSKKITPYLEKYISDDNGRFKDTKYKCPKKLLYQFTEENKLHISHLCCDNLKKKPVMKWQDKNNKKITMTGMRRSEGGQRNHIPCVIIHDGKLKKFHPLAPVSDEWVDWFIEKNNIQLCKLYYKPYEFKRTGCKGCPFALTLQYQLDVMERLMPNERKQCEMIWKPVYQEYRRIGYRLKNQKQMSIDDFM